MNTFNVLTAQQNLAIIFFASLLELSTVNAFADTAHLMFLGEPWSDERPQIMLRGAAVDIGDYFNTAIRP